MSREKYRNVFMKACCNVCEDSVETLKNLFIHGDIVKDDRILYDGFKCALKNNDNKITSFILKKKNDDISWAVETAIDRKDEKTIPLLLSYKTSFTEGEYSRVMDLLVWFGTKENVEQLTSLRSKIIQYPKYHEPSGPVLYRAGGILMMI